MPGRWQPAPAVAESGDLWDGAEAGPGVAVPEHVADLTVQECRWADGDLSGRRFTGLRCRDTQFVHCDLSGTVLDGAVLTRVTFVDCRLTGVVLGAAALTDVRVSDGQADLANLRMARAGHLLFENTSLRGADFYQFTGTDVGLVGCDLAGATFHEAALTRAYLHGSSLDDVQGALALRGSRISPDQQVGLGAALLAALEIEITEQQPG